LSAWRTWVVVASLAACASNRAPPPARVVEPAADESDPEAEPLAGDPPTARDAGCARVPRGAVCLPAGLSGLGADTGEAHFEERPPHAVVLGAFAIDRREVSSRAYQRCVSEGRCGAPGCEVTRSSRTSARCLSWADAAKYCAWRGGRLPTEAEWERAAAGLLPAHRTYPWGDELPEAGLPRDVTPEGVEGLAGGVAEWVADGGGFYPALPRVRDAGMDGADGSGPNDVTEEPPEDLPERTESGLYVLDAWRGRDDSPWRVARGGDDAIALGRRTTTLRRFRQPGDRLPWVGLRCVY
jgi:formylglycine-generating enzyme required for sulfatase activity